MRFLCHILRVVFLFCILLSSLSLSFIYSPPPAHAAPPQQTATITGWFASEQDVVAPLQPVNIGITIAGYHGSATLLIFDSAGASVGAWECSIPTTGNTTVQVVPRGKPGTHWAALFAGGSEIASGPIYTLDAQTTIQTGLQMIDEFYPRVQQFMLNCTLEYWLNGKLVHGYRSPDSPLIWLRDHYYQGRGFRYFETDVTSTIDAFRNYQQPDGSFPDFLARPKYNIPALRTPVEADVEYLFVLAVYEAWKMTGDDQWLIANLEAMQRAVNYSLTHPLRWSPEFGLIKRPFTIDTWDFEYGPTTLDPTTNLPAPRHWIDEWTRWGIFHGDNTGMIRALRALAEIEIYLGQPENAQYHYQTAQDMHMRLNAVSWNGTFFRHHVKLIPWDVPGVDEETQLSLSNAYALNRGVLTINQARAIIYEYRSRLRRPNNVAFAEWWSIDPPFPPGSFGMAGRLGEQPGYYVNGGIMPLVGGELARGAFRYGYEEYGFDILRRYYDMIKSTGETYLWYHPTGGPGATGDDVLSTDGWGSSAMLAALIEGAAGVEDIGVRYSNVLISPRWTAASIHNAYVVTRYAASDGYVAYRWRHIHEPQSNRSVMQMDVTGSGEKVHLRLLLPPQIEAVSRVTLNGAPVDSTMDTIGTSRYLSVSDIPNGVVHVQVDLNWD